MVLGVKYGVAVKKKEPVYCYVLAKTQKELTEKLHMLIETYRDSDLTEESSRTLGEWLDRWINNYMSLTVR